MNYNIEKTDIEILKSCMLCDNTDLSLISSVQNNNGLVFFATSCCTKCGFVFRSIRPKQKWFLHAWSLRLDDTQDSVHKITENQQTEDRRYNRYANLASVLSDAVDYCDKQRRLLDVGCGPGTGLKAFIDNQWTVAGVEPDPVLGRRPVHGLDIHTCTIENYHPEALYDVVTSLHSLEHIHDPQSFLTSITTRLVPGGLLYVEVPNLFDFVDYKDSWYLEHMNNFTVDTLNRVGLNAGLTSKNVFSTKTYPLGHKHIAILFQKEPVDAEDVEISPKSYGEYVTGERTLNPLVDINQNEYLAKLDNIYKSKKFGNRPVKFITPAITNLKEIHKFTRLVKDGDLMRFTA